MAEAVRIEGLAETKRDLRGMGKSLEGREMTKGLKEGAQVVAKASGPFAARKTGKMAAGYRAGASGNTAFVRNRVPWAGVQEFGGVIRPKGAPVVIKAHPAVMRALKDKEDQVVEKVGDAFDEIARRHGWK